MGGGVWPEGCGVSLFDACKDGLGPGFDQGSLVRVPFLDYSIDLHPGILLLLGVMNHWVSASKSGVVTKWNPGLYFQLFGGL